MHFDTKKLTRCALIAAIYVALTMLSNALNLAYGPIQLRFSEALCVLPFLFPATAPGLFVGCLAANLLSPYGPLDIVVGSLATLIAAVWTSRVKRRWLAPLPPVVCNTVLVGFTIAFAQTGFTAALPAAWLYNGLTVGVGELGACYVLGMLLLKLLPRVDYFKPMIAPKETA
jgi:uncharacterized membrane protein